MFQPRLILCPVELSDGGASHLRLGIDLTRQYSATLLLLHVADTLGPEKLSFEEITTRVQPEAHVQDLEKSLRRLVPEGTNVPIRFLLKDGDPPRAVEQVAREEHCDLIVVSTHGRTGLGHLFMGSIAERIVQLAPCPVLVCKRAVPA
jgi:nucleotide-binding universal stress UspA family protein